MSETTTIYLTRHGQTEWNVQKRFQGHNDSPLTELGIKQAMWLGESLKDHKMDLIYSSSSQRAIKTAELLKGNRPLPINICKAFREIDLGIWEGITQDEAKSKHAHQYHNFWNDPEAFYVENCETFQQVNERVINKLHHIVGEHIGKTIFIVTHTVVIKLIMAYFEQRELKNIWNPPYIYPTCLCKIEINKNNHTIILHGDMSHYKEGIVES
ncbi:histidine phosphatase family protein [Paenibacillus arenilitoris]|uniref:Histidine phosphatase family protein n=1 Tax=Paenibacillus arenilitoris TaxID=2772299 RepID=A0A927H463_9BACL|nr:histidine phosphatase family protein [Paenibacillus arenilitoris]MBD2867138.1 histidine phosphatase family protein [Paenibacillus arenilitoris]